MNNYSIALFLHVVGALGFFMVLGVEWLGLARIKSAGQLEEVRAIVEIVKGTNRLGAVSMLTAISTGLYLTLTVWGGVPWLLVMLGALVLEIVLFVAVARPRMASMEKALAAETRPSSPTLLNLVNDPILWVSTQTRVAIMLGIVFLKYAKPDLSVSLLAIGVAIVLGLVSALPALRRAGPQERPAG